LLFVVSTPRNIYIIYPFNSYVYYQNSARILVLNNAAPVFKPRFICFFVDEERGEVLFNLAFINVPFPVEGIVPPFLKLLFCNRGSIRMSEYGSHGRGTSNSALREYPVEICDRSARLLEPRM